VETAPSALRAATQAAILAAGLAIGFAVLLGFGLLQPDDLLVRGELGPSESLIAQDFGPGDNPGMTGFDGQQTYAIAREFPDLDRAASALDSPRYRLLRIVQPAVASAAPAGAPLVVALLALGILGCGLASFAVGDIASRHGHDRRAGWLVGLALVSSIAVTTVDALAYGLALTAATLADRKRFLPAVVLFSIAALTRESGAVIAVATAVALLPQVRWRAVPLAVVPGIALLAWYLALGQIVGGDLPKRWAVLGMLRVDARTTVIGLVMWLLCVLAVIAWRDTPVLCATAAAFAAWTLVYTEDMFRVGTLNAFRINAVAIALGVAGLLEMARRNDLQLEPFERPVELDRSQSKRAVPHT
jgi:hypothetical protein